MLDKLINEMIAEKKALRSLATAELRKRFGLTDNWDIDQPPRMTEATRDFMYGIVGPNNFLMVRGTYELEAESGVMFIRDMINFITTEGSLNLLNNMEAIMDFVEKERVRVEQIKASRQSK